MNIFLWILQILLAAQFLWHGWIMVFPPPELLDIINSNVGTWQRIFIGVSEALGALGLILPGLTRTLPRLTVWSAVGLMIVAISASVYHLMRGEITSSIYTAVLFVIILFVAIMRWKVKPTANKEIQ